MASKTNTSNYQGGQSSDANQASSQSSGSQQQSNGSRSISSLEDALRFLDRAIVENKDELQERLSSDFQDLKSALSQLGPQVKSSLRQYGTQAMSYAQDLKDQSMEKTREMATGVNTQIRSNPWAYIGGAALGALVFGYMMGRRSESEY